MHDRLPSSVQSVIVEVQLTVLTEIPTCMTIMCAIIMGRLGQMFSTGLKAISFSAMTLLMWWRFCTELLLLFP